MKKAEIQSFRLVGLFVIFSLILLFMTTITGPLASLYYSDYFSLIRDHWKIPFQLLRPLHTFTAMTWVFVSGLAFVLYFLLLHHSEKAELIKSRFKTVFVLWLLAGLLGIASLFNLNFTGREYIIFPPYVSLFVMGGWLIYGFTFFSLSGLKRTDWPIYKWMWGTSIFLFITSFTEGHFYLLESISVLPLRDMAIEWKSYGSLVGSFNLIVYGNLIFFSERITGDKEYAFSRKAFLLFIIGTLNSFTNSVHHTYHLPQGHWAKTFAFVVSMLEVIIFIKVFFDLWGLKKVIKLKEKYPLAAFFMASATLWTFIQLAMGILLSIPPLNSVVHGTTVVLAHSMGAMIGIDTMAQLAVLSFLYQELFPGRQSPARILFLQCLIVFLNLALILFSIILIFQGIQSGMTLHGEGLLPSTLTFSDFFSKAFPMSGFLISFCLGAIALSGIFDWHKARNVI